MRIFTNIQFHISCPYTPQHNGLVERRHRHVVELSLATMLHANIPQCYWPEIFESITFIINRLPSSSIDFHTPHFLLYNANPDYGFFKVLGCKCFPFTRPTVAHKLEPRFSVCVFLSYSSIYKCYKCLNLTTNKITFSWHVIFVEDSFPFRDTTSPLSLVSIDQVLSPLVVLQPKENTSSSNQRRIHLLLPFLILILLQPSLFILQLNYLYLPKHNLLCVCMNEGHQEYSLLKYRLLHWYRHQSIRW
jgi:hypothetical protein